MYTNYVEAVKALEKPTLARMITRTEVKMNKKDVATKTIANPYVGAVKITTMIVELAPHYESAVNEQRVVENKEADFEASSRKWGTSLGNGIIENNNKLYVSFIAKEHVLTNYMLDDQIIDKSELEPFMPKKKDSGTQNLDNAVVFRTIAVENIMELEII